MTAYAWWAGLSFLSAFFYIVVVMQDKAILNFSARMQAKPAMDGVPFRRQLRAAIRRREDKIVRTRTVFLILGHLSFGIALVVAWSTNWCLSI